MGSALYVFMFVRFLLFLSSFYLMVTNSSSSMHRPLCHDSEGSALLQFKQSFLIDEHASGDPSAYPKVAMWKSHGEGEREGSDCCSWDGVECDRETGHVIGLHLASSCLYGSINSSSTLFSLVHLQRLDLSDNDFNYSEIPFGVGQLSRLRSLDLSFSGFSGQIPSELLALSKLVFLDLSANPKLQLQKPGLRNLVQNLTHLKKLHLSQLPSLQYLTVRDNLDLISYLPEFQETSPLKMLDLAGTSFSDNQLSGQIPSSLFELVNLQGLYLLSNYLNGTVELQLLSKLKNLIYLQLSDNRLSFLSYTRTNATLPKFKHLGLGSCNLTEFPDFLQNQHELEIITLSENKIHGPIPKWVWNISKETLVTLELSENFLTGFDQRPFVLPWSRLHTLRLDSNMLQGPLPVPPPSTVEYLVSGNKLTGEISPLIWNMTSLELLDLSSNNLSGRIPQCLANFSRSLFVLDLGSNSLDGPIPEICTVSHNLNVIDLGDNQFQGQIPRSLVNCTMLEHLVLGNNKINDIFPFWLGALPQLQVLILRSNRFHGAIGSWHTNFRFPKLRIIDLSDNEFIGDLPSEYFQNWDAMKLTDIASGLRYMQISPMIDLKNNVMITGYMYSMTMTNKGMQRFYERILDTFMAIDFSGNNFKGQIPTSIGSLKGLHLLNLGGNDLTGHIPSSLGNLTQLESLDLSQNKLSGEIPWQLTRLTFLEFFNVSHNHLTGHIPQGKQFATFENASFDGNLGLCGSPLSRECGSSEALPPTSSSSKQGSTTKFDWKIVLMGYGSGLLIGVSIGYCLTSWKHEWFVKTIGKRQRKWTRKEGRGQRG
ncbi:receptor like protein 27-like [Vitis riparia]|uniref:receptor like protein 27-like n=1 Tax=Vitis riparia TaxID=96939 RepID=UPI00155A32B2|nr:receptor like protein 27-like [Vitis riparia]